MCHTSQTQPLVWEVRLPDKRSSTSWGPKQTGTLLITTEDRGTECLTLPMTVARKLASKQKTSEIHPQTRSELVSLANDLSISCAKARINRLIDRREYASTEIKEKLRQDGYHHDVIDSCLHRAYEIGLVDDMRFADSFIRSKVYAGWGIHRIVMELSKRGISAEQVPGWPMEFLDPECELDRAVELARAKHCQGSRAFEKLVRFLCGRGFSLSVSKRAASRVLEELYDASC